MIHTGDCLDVMAAIEPESVDAIVTDPPYGLEFMGKEWDRLWRTDQTGPSRRTGRLAGQTRWLGNGGPSPRYEGGMAAQAWHQQWAEAAYRVAKPSAYLLAFGGTRTVHRMTVALEDAGWIIRDMLVWAYASGFPKSKASLKPAWEPIVMARKPGPLRELAIDACRIPAALDDLAGWHQSGREPHQSGSTWKLHESQEVVKDPAGRWPANVILTDPIFDGGVEGVIGGGAQNSPAPYTRRTDGDKMFGGGWDQWTPAEDTYGDSGTYSRFFLIPKADRADREPVLGGLPLRDENFMAGLPDPRMNRPQVRNPRANHHPTVKPVDLMRHLVRLVTPPGGTVLDPFLGSGTTAIAAEMEGFPWIGVEREAEYVAIAEARLNGTQRGLGIA